MSKLTVSAFASVLVIAFIVRTSLLASQDPMVPSNAMTVAEAGNVEQLATALLAAGVPVGVVIRNEDNRRARRPTDASAVARAKDEPLSKVLQTFTDRNPAYRVARTTSAAIRLVPDQSRCAGLLQVKAPAFSRTAQAHAVAHDIVRWWTRDTRSVPPPGHVGSDDSYRKDVRVDVPDGTSMGQALDELSAQAHLGWAVRETIQRAPEEEDKEGIEITTCNFVLFSPNSWLETSWTVQTRRAMR